MISKTHESDDEPLVERLAEEILERKRRGERPSVEEYCERYPDHEAELLAFLPTLLAVEDLKPDSGDATGPIAGADVHGSQVESIGDYRILRELGRGGMGIVYEAEQQGLGRRVALKVLAGQSAGGPKAIARFQSEARAAARLHHTNIVPVFDVGEDGECLYYAMQLIQGQSLDLVIDDLKVLRCDHEMDPAHVPPKRTIARSMMSGEYLQENLADQEGQPDTTSDPDPTETLDRSLQASSSVSLPGDSELSTAQTDRRAYYFSVARIGLQTARALAYSHERGIIHRDIKPSNLILDAAGVVWVTDFGLAKSSDSDLTHTGDILGTLRYMSPERFKGRCDVRADIYALGLTMYEMLLLEDAFTASDHLNLVDRITNENPPPPRSRDADVPPDLETIILKSIDKDPKGRYQSADDLAEDLERFIHDRPIKARRVSAAERLARWSRRNRGLAVSLLAVATMMLFGIIGASVAALRFQRQERQQRDLAEANSDLATEASKAKQVAENSRDLAERATYLSDLRLALELLESDDEGSAQAARTLATYKDEHDQHGYLWNHVRHRYESSGDLYQHPVDKIREKKIDLAFSEDGHLLSLSRDGLMLKWGERKEPLARFNFANGIEVRWAQMSPSGDTVAVVDHRNRIHLFDRETRAKLFRIKPDGVTHSLQFLPGRRLAAFMTSPAHEAESSGTDPVSEVAAVQTWDIDTGNPLAETLRLKSLPNASFPDGFARAADPESDEFFGREFYKLAQWESLIRSSWQMIDDERVIGWGSRDHWHLTVATPSEIQHNRMSGPNMNVSAVSHHGGIAAAGFNGGAVNLLEVGEGTDLERTAFFVPHGGGTYSLAFSSDDRLLVTGGSEGSVTVWDVGDSDEPKMIRRTKSLDSAVYTVAISPDHRRIAAASWNGQVSVSDMQATTSRVIGRTDREICDVAFHGGGDFVAMSGRDSGTQLWHLRPDFVVRHFPEPSAACIFAPRSQHLVFAQGPEIVIWDVERDQEVDRFKPELAGATLERATANSGRTSACFSAIDVSRDEKMIALACSAPAVYSQGGLQRVIVLDGKSGEQLFSYDTGGRHGSISFSPDGNRMAVSHRYSTFSETRIYRTSDWSLEHVVERMQESRFSPDGKWLAGCCVSPEGEMNSYELVLQAVGNWNDHRDLAVLSDSLMGLAFSSDGRSLHCIGLDRTMRVYDLATKREVLKMSTGQNWPYSIAIGPDDTRLAYGSKVIRSRSSRLGGLTIASTRPPIWRDPVFACEIVRKTATQLKSDDQRLSLYRSMVPHVDTFRELVSDRAIGPEIGFPLAESLEAAGYFEEATETAQSAESQVANQLSGNPMLAALYADSISNRLDDEIEWHAMQLIDDPAGARSRSLSTRVLSSEQRDVVFMLEPTDRDVRSIRFEILPAIRPGMSIRGSCWRVRCWRSASQNQTAKVVLFSRSSISQKLR